MTEEEKWSYINALDDELLMGGVTLSEWTVLVVQNADISFVAGAHLACLITAVAGIESHLRYEYADQKRTRLVELIDRAALPEDLREDLHQLRKLRNEWVHIDSPWEDEKLLLEPAVVEKELETAAHIGIRCLRRVLYTEQWI